MAKKNYNYKGEYVYGSAAPKREVAAPKREPQRETRQRPNKAEENVKQSRGFGAVFTFFVTTAVAAVLFTSTRYISEINLHNEQAGKLVSLQGELNELREVNDQKELDIDTSVDFNYIYNVATKELGMIHASDDQVITYESGESEYVIQYSNILGE